MTIEEKCTVLLRESLIQSGMTETEVAKRLGVSRRTISNWLSGSSFPTFPQGMRWFMAIKVRIMPWFMKIYYYNEKDLVSKKTCDSQIENDLNTYLQSLTPNQKRKLHFIFCGNHGSSPYGLLERYVADLQTPLRDRVGVAATTLLNYDLAKAHGDIVCPDEPQPDIEVLRESVNLGKEAILNDEKMYVHNGGAL